MQTFLQQYLNGHIFDYMLAGKKTQISAVLLFIMQLFSILVCMNQR